jgi:hypothetical protein
MTIYQDDPQVMKDFVEFKDGVMKSRDIHGSIGFVGEEEEEPQETDSEEM